METNAFDYLPELSVALKDNFGEYFDAREQIRNKKELIDTIQERLPDYSRREIDHAMNSVFTKFNFMTRWSDILQWVFWNLPGYWQKVTTNPGIRASTMFLMTNGTVLLQESNGTRWRKLTPDANGSYIDGTWSDVAPMRTPRLYYASGVLNDGRLIVCGGEYEGTGTAVRGVKCEIYDPVLDRWTDLASPPGITQLGDAPCVVLPDGRFMVGAINSQKCAIFDPTTSSWTAAADKPTTSSEESWVLLPDNTVITIRADGTRTADKYVIATDTWVAASSTPFLLVETSSSEIGAGVLLNNGRVFFIGATNKTAIYVPPTNPGDPGSWQSGPDIPNNAGGQMVGAKDAPACLMTNGKVLLAVGPVDGISNDFLSPTYFYEFDGANLQPAVDPPNSGNEPYRGRMLLLPNGQILFTAESDEVYAYIYPQRYTSAWRPAITNCSWYLVHGFNYTLQGTQLNGLSQAVGYGDDSTAATNYPLVRIKNLASGQVRYCRTHGFSTMGVATGSILQSANFLVPWDLELGASELTVIANGIPSQPIPVSIHRNPFRDVVYYDWVKLLGSLADGDLWVLGPNGPIPVDPWGPKYREEAEEAWNTIRRSVGKLQRLGNELEVKRQIKAAKQTGPIVIEDEEEEKKERQEHEITTVKTTTRKQTKNKK